MFDIPGYQVQHELHSGNRSLVLRCIRDADALPVVLKTPAFHSPQLDEAARYRYTYDLIHDLNIEGVCKPLDLDSYQNRPVLVLEDSQGTTLKAWKNSHSPGVVEILRVALDVTKSLKQLHNSNVLHKDINPSNIVVTPETLQVQIIDFDLASRLQREQMEAVAPNQLQGTLAYIAPEQTGRMNRQIDRRSDLYSWGATLYELLTGSVPFEKQDPVSLIHSHIAIQPTPPIEKNSLIPPVLSRIVMKLLAKNPEDRYQGAAGLHSDLKRCLEQLVSDGKVEDFVLGASDVSPSLELSHRLYGRQNEIDTLLHSFSKIRDGGAGLLLVSGYSGVGKTSLVKEIHKPLSETHGHLISGKSNQFQNVPYSALIQALRQLTQDLLTLPEAELAERRTTIQEALSPVGQVLLDVIPELELLVGPQPSVPGLPPTEARNRFTRIFQKFIQSVTSYDRPLALFLDDLQWARSATFQLLQKLLTDGETHNLLVIGAYRDNEVSDIHPLHKLCDELEQEQVAVTKVELSPLVAEDIQQLVADTLGQSLEEVHPLSEVILTKTHGNPFFVERFLLHLYAEEVLSLDSNSGQWSWDLETIKTMDITENVAELLIREIQRLPSATQSMIHLASCIGNQFDLQTLATVAQQSEVDVAKALWPCVQSELLIPLDDAYRFAAQESMEESPSTSTSRVRYRFGHDRIQQRAYESASKEERERTHLDIGRLFLTHHEKGEQLFDTVNHLNLGSSLLETSEEALKVAMLNRSAGDKAMIATAYQAARDYYQQGLSLLETSESTETDLILLFKMGMATASFMCGDFDTTERLETEILSASPDKKTHVQTIKIRLKRLMFMGQHAEVLEESLLALELFGFQRPQTPEEWQELAAKENEKLALLLEKNDIAELANAPEILDPEVLLELEILAEIAPAASTQMHIYTVLIPWLVRLSVEHGVSASSAVGYVSLSVLHSAVGDYEKADAFGRLALKINERLQIAMLEAPLSHIYGVFVCHWSHPIQEAFALTERAVEAGLETGVFTNASWAAMNIPWFHGALGEDLSLAYEKNEALLQLALTTFQSIDAIQTLLGAKDPMLRLMGDQKTLEQLQQDGNTLAAIYERMEHYPMALANIRTLNLQASYVLEDFDTALQEIEVTGPMIPMTAGLICTSEFSFYACLTLTSLYPDATPEQQESYTKTILEHRDKLKNWMQYCSENQAYKYNLVCAEWAAIQGDMTDALGLYEEAIQAAHEQGFIQGEAIALERAGLFYIQLKNTRAAQGYLNDARNAYLRWGAMEKVTQLEKEHLFLRQRSMNISGSLSTSTQSGTSLLDIQSILQATRSVSKEIVLEELLKQLMNTAIENAGAQRGALLLRQRKKLMVEAYVGAKGETPSVLQSQRLKDAMLPQKVIRYVERSLQTVVLGDAPESERFSQDPYIVKHKPLSILCIPIMSQNKLVGIFYLENSLTSNAFTEERCNLLNVISAQAAISIDNANLYNHLEEKVKERTQELHQAMIQLKEAQVQLVQSEKMASLGTLVAGVAHELNNPSNFAKAGSHNLENKLQAFQLYLGELTDDKGFTKVLEKKFGEMQQSLRSIVSGTSRIHGIVEDLRTFSRLDEAERKEANIIEGLITALDLVQSNYKDSVQFVHDFQADPRFDCWPAQLNQAFMNLAINACEAIQKKQAQTDNDNSGVVRVSTTEKDKELIICFEDNGCGMSTKTLSHVFEPFFTTKEVGQGTGLGLAIVYSVIQMHQGSIEFDSTPHSGTTATVRLPLNA